MFVRGEYGDAGCVDWTTRQTVGDSGDGRDDTVTVEGCCLTFSSDAVLGLC